MTDEAEQIFEIKPCRTAVERLISAISLHGADPEISGKGGIPELTTGDWLAALSGSGDPLGEAVVSLRFLEHEACRRKLVRALNTWGWWKLLERRSRLKVSPEEHQRLAAMSVREYCDWSRLSRDEKIKVLGVGRSRWDALKEHYADLVDRQVRGEGVVIRHLVRRIR